MISLGMRVRAFRLFSYRPAVLESIGEDLAVLVDQLASGALQPELGFEGDWRELAEAVTALRERRYQGKAVLRVD
jgi:NADPH:quinone reductase-like Zn-dependent oxidoreductase